MIREKKWILNLQNVKLKLKNFLQKYLSLYVKINCKISKNNKLLNYQEIMNHLIKK